MELFNIDFVQQQMSEPIKGIIHIGAHHAQETQDYVPLGVPVLWFEGYPQFAKWMFRRIESINNHHGFVALLSDKDNEEVDFWITADDYASSIFKPELHQELQPQAQITKVERLTTTRFDTYCKDHLEGRFNFEDFNLLVLDVQGAEKVVWDGMGKYRKYFKAIISEYSTIEYYRDGPRIEDLDMSFGAYGFVRVYPSKGQETPHGDGIWIV